MAKEKPHLEGSILDKAKRAKKQAETDQDPTGPTITRGVGLKESEWANLADIGDELGLTTHAITAYGLRYFLKQYRTGNIQLEQKPTLPST